MLSFSKKSHLSFVILLNLDDHEGLFVQSIGITHKNAGRLYFLHLVAQLLRLTLHSAQLRHILGFIIFRQPPDANARFYEESRDQITILSV